MPLSVLYIHPSGTFGGASRSLLEMLRAFQAGSVAARVISQRGRVPEMLAREGVPVIATRGIAQFDNTRYGYYRGLRWLVLLRELSFWWSMRRALQAAQAEWPRPDIVHVNELTAIPAALLAKKLFGAPVVMHVRSVQRPMAIGLRGRLLRELVGRCVDQLVAIDTTVRESLPADLPVAIVHNGFPGAPAAARACPARAGTGRRRLRIGFVGLLLKLKGIYEFIEAARLCAERGLDVEFVIAGENARVLRGLKGYLLKRFNFAADVRADLERYIAEHALEGRVKLIGFTADVKAVYDGLDVLCFPSHLDACGRPVFEAAFSRVPSIVAVSDPKPDTIVHGETGLCIPARDPKALADAVEHFCTRPEEVERMGEAAYRLAMENFDIAANAAKMLAIYRRLVARPGATAGAAAHCEDVVEH